MAKVIDKVLKARAEYPWDEWGNGKAWEVTKGKDFVCSIAGMAAALYGHAKSKNKKVVLSQNRANGTIQFQFTALPAKDKKSPEKKTVKKVPSKKK